MKDTRVGNVVVAKSGGPWMTVKRAGKDESLCIWFDSTNNLHEAMFPNETLEKKVE